MALPLLQPRTLLRAALESLQHVPQPLETITADTIGQDVYELYVYHLNAYALRPLLADWPRHVGTIKDILKYQQQHLSEYEYTQYERRLFRWAGRVADLGLIDALADTRRPSLREDLSRVYNMAVGMAQTSRIDQLRALSQQIELDESTILEILNIGRTNDAADVVDLALVTYDNTYPAVHEKLRVHPKPVAHEEPVSLYVITGTHASKILELIQQDFNHRLSRKILDTIVSLPHCSSYHRQLLVDIITENQDANMWHTFMSCVSRAIANISVNTLSMYMSQLHATFNENVTSPMDYRTILKHMLAWSSTNPDPRVRDYMQSLYTTVMATPYSVPW